MTTPPSYTNSGTGQPTLGVPPDTSDSLLDLLFSQNAISKQIYESIKVKMASTGESVDKIISELHILPEERLVKAKAELLNIPFVSLATMAFAPEALNFVPQAVAQRFELIPFVYDEKSKTLSVAMANPIDLDAIQFVQLKTGLSIKAYAAVPREVTNAIASQYNTEIASEVGKAVQETQDLNQTKTVDSKQIGEIIKEAPIAKIVSTILEYGVNSRASDIHIEPLEDRVRVRYRIDGILYEKLNLPKSVQ
jgi:type IV pilus assembly protein PilB